MLPVDFCSAKSVGIVGLQINVIVYYKYTGAQVRVNMQYINRTKNEFPRRVLSWQLQGMINYTVSLLRHILVISFWSCCFICLVPGVLHCINRYIRYASFLSMQIQIWVNHKLIKIHGLLKYYSLQICAELK